MQAGAIGFNRINRIAISCAVIRVHYSTVDGTAVAYESYKYWDEYLGVKDPQGVMLEDGEIINAQVVVNASGPHSFVINRMAGVEAGMKIKTRALRHEVVHVPALDDFNRILDAKTFNITEQE